MANPSLQIGNSNWAIKESNLLGYSTAGTKFLPQPITMTRASAGTRVNPQGLVETVELLGSELVTNGDFSNGTTGWTEEGSSTISVGTHQGRTNVADINIGNTSASSRIQQLFDYVNGKTYKISVDVYLVSGSFRSDSRDQLVSGDFVSTSTTGSWLTLTSTFTAIQTGQDAVWLRSINEVSQFYVDSISIKEVTRNNLARVDYDGTASSLLVEPQRTNVITYSEDFTQSYWVKNNTTITSNETISPDGVINADSIIANTTNSTHYIRNNYTAVTASTSFTYSIYIKPNGYTKVGLRDDAQTGAFLTYNLTTKAIISSASMSVVAKELNNGWVKLSFTYLGGSNGVIGLSLFLLDDNYVSGDPNSYSFAGDNTSGFYIWGGQIEQGSYATSYIPTSGSSVTRVADQYTKTGISNLINSEEGVLFAEMAALSDDGTTRYITINDGSTSNFVSINFFSNSTITTRVAIGGTSTFLTSGVVTQTDNFKVALKYKLNDYVLWVNGIEVDSNNSLGVFAPNTLTRLDFARFVANNFYGKLKQLQIFKTALTDTELATLTTI